MQHLASEGSASRLAMVAAEKVLLAPGPAEELGRPSQALGRPPAGWMAPAVSFGQVSEAQAGKGRPIHMQAPRGLHNEVLHRMSSGGGGPHGPGQSLHGGLSGTKHLSPRVGGLHG